MANPDFWRGKRVFITGHTGFKGAWMCLWLHHLGARVTGFALPPPTDPSLFQLARAHELVRSVTGDVRDLPALEATMRSAEPEIVIHMAAQSLVRYSYEHPVDTFSTNVLGVAHCLDAVRRVSSVRAAVIVTSDKCYRNNEWFWGYRETERLGGDDPYSASKACAEHVVASYQHSFFRKSEAQSVAVASARAGNVIGGGDWALDRLVPDVMRSLLAGKPTLIRNPRSTRPWQHVLEPLSGYLRLAEELYGRGHDFASAWNFGPNEQSERTVGWIVDRLYRLWGVDFEWTLDTAKGPAESTLLKLDASKAHVLLDWFPRLDLDTTLEWIVGWTRRYAAGGDMRTACIQDITRYSTVGRLS